MLTPLIVAIVVKISDKVASLFTIFTGATLALISLPSTVAIVVNEVPISASEEPTLTSCLVTLAFISIPLTEPIVVKVVPIVALLQITLTSFCSWVVSLLSKSTILCLLVSTSLDKAIYLSLSIWVVSVVSVKVDSN